MMRARLVALIDLAICALQRRDRTVLSALWGAVLKPPGFRRRRDRQT